MDTGLSRLAGVVAAAVGMAAHGEGMHHSPHQTEATVIIGLKAGGGLEAEDGASGLGMGSLFFEDTLVPGWLELELGLAHTRSLTTEVLSFEPLLKKPFRVSEVVDLYVGLGAAVGARTTGREEPRLLLGGVATVGFYAWLSDWLGLDVDLTVQLAWSGRLASETVGAIGVVARI